MERPVAMMSSLRPHLTYANVVSSLCLFVLLGGTAYAAAQLPANSVGSAQIRAKAVKGSDLGSDAVTSAKVKNRSLRAKDFAPGQLGVGRVTVQRTDFALPDDSTQGLEVPCDTGQRVLAGGSSTDALTSDDIHVNVSRPSRTGAEPGDGETFNAWRISYRNPDSAPPSPTIVHAWAICAEG